MKRLGVALALWLAALVASAGCKSSGNGNGNGNGNQNTGVCGDGVREGAEACDDGNTETEGPPDALTAGACISDCSIDMDRCGDAIHDAASGEGCDDGNADDEDACNASCQVNDHDIGQACTAAGAGQDSADFTEGTISGCDNVPDTFGGCVKACLRSIDPGFGQPQVYNPGGYCTLYAVGCSGGFVCGSVPQPGDVDTCTSCPAGFVWQEETRDVMGSTIVSRSCLRPCTSEADCRWKQWDARFNDWGQYRCVPSRADPNQRVCQDARMAPAP